jgi:hypothetical protein
MAGGLRLVWIGNIDGPKPEFSQALKTIFPLSFVRHRECQSGGQGDPEDKTGSGKPEGGDPHRIFS